ncbi:MAG: DNA polymerase III subunit delta [Patescibacteria group bacterium]
MIIFLYGPDTYRSRQRLKQLKEAFIAKHDKTGANLVALEGAKLSVEKLNSAVKTGGLLSKKRLVVIDEVMGQNKKPTLLKELAEFLTNEKIPEDTILVFWEGDILGGKQDYKKKRKAKGKTANPLLDHLVKQKYAEEYSELSPVLLRSWVTKRFKDNKAAVEEKAIDTIISLVGTDLWQLANEVDKLSAMRLGKKVMAEDVTGNVSGKFDANIFALTDAIGEKDQSTAIKLLHKFLKTGEPPLYILTMLVRQFRILFNVLSVASEEPNHFTVAKRLQLHPFVAQKAMRQIKHFNKKELAGIYQSLTDLDRQLKTTRDDPELLFDQFILQACG